MSDEHEVKPSPAPPAPPKTEVATLQGGPAHMRSVRVQTDQDTLTIDTGNKTHAAYRRRIGGDSPAGAPFDFVEPTPQATEGVQP